MKQAAGVGKSGGRDEREGELLGFGEDFGDAGDIGGLVDAAAVGLGSKVGGVGFDEEGV